MGAGVHLSEGMAKRICLVGGVALWLAHVSLTPPRGAPGGGRTGRSPLPISKRDVDSRVLFSSRGANRSDLGRTRSRAILLAMGRVLVSLLLAAVGCTELWRLVGTPFTSFDHGDGHDALYLRLPQVVKYIYTHLISNV